MHNGQALPLKNTMIMEERYDPAQPDNKCGIATFDFSGVPFVWYILTQKRVKGFFKWLGISTAAAPPLNVMFVFLRDF